MRRAYRIVYSTYAIEISAADDARTAWHRYGHVSLEGRRIPPVRVEVITTGEVVPEELWR